MGTSTLSSVGGWQSTVGSTTQRKPRCDGSGRSSLATTTPTESSLCVVSLCLRSLATTTPRGSSCSESATSSARFAWPLFPTPHCGDRCHCVGALSSSVEAFLHQCSCSGVECALTSVSIVVRKFPGCGETPVSGDSDAGIPARG